MADAGIPVGVLMAPIIPAVADDEIEDVIAAAAEAGASYCAYILLRLPLEVKDLFSEWLQAHFPERARHVESLISQMRGGKAYDAAFGTRMRGTGIFADLLKDRFQLACARNGFANERAALRTDLFALPSNTPQMDLF